MGRVPEEKIEKLKEDEVEIVSPKTDRDDPYIKRTRFTDTSFTDTKVMVYEKSNSFALGYYGATRTEQALLCAGLVAAYNVHRNDPYDEEAIKRGIQVSVPIRHVAKMMGYEVGCNNKTFYNTIKKAAKGLTDNGSVFSENLEDNSFSVYNTVSQVDYNQSNDGRVTFTFSPGASRNFLNNKRNFTLYSLILNNQMDKHGKDTAVRLHEILKTDLFRAEEKPFTRYYDMVDFKCKMFLINTNNEKVQEILENKMYSMQAILSSDKLAYERLCLIEELDSHTRDELRKLKSSEEYRAAKKYKGTSEYREALSRAKKLKSGQEYEAIYFEKIKPVQDVDNKIRILNKSIVCQYTEWADFKKRILVTAQQAFLETLVDSDLMDLMFEYEPVYYKKKVIGINFTIYTIEQYKKKEQENGTQMSIFEYIGLGEKTEKKPSDLSVYETTGGANKDGFTIKDPITQMRKQKKEKWEDTLDLFSTYVNSYTGPDKIMLSASEILKLSKMADSDMLKKQYNLMLKQSSVRSPIAWMTAAIKEDFTESRKTASGTKSNQFNQFMQQDYDFDEIERTMLSN